MTSGAYQKTMDKLEEGIRELVDSDRWQEFLRAQATFHQYSYRNVLLISKQCPQAASVAGFHAWRRLGRSVRKGERAIWIFAPSQRRTVGEAGAPQSVTRFISVPVFDISQTEGRDLPMICERLEAGDDFHAFERLSNAATMLGFQVECCDLELGVNGECSFIEHVIKIESRNSEAQQVKSIAHELAHAILHEQTKDRARAELEAESVAYVVCSQLGIDSGDYSFGYVASWVGDTSLAKKALEDSCAEIARASQKILSLVSPENGHPHLWRHDGSQSITIHRPSTRVIAGR